MGTQDAAPTTSAQDVSTKGSDDEESVDVTGAGFDDDLTSQAGGKESEHQSDLESDTAADQDPDFEPPVNNRRSTRSGSSCALAALSAPSTKGKGRGKKRKVVEPDDEVVANVRPGTTTPVVTPTNIPKSAAVPKPAVQVIDLPPPPALHTTEKKPQKRWRASLMPATTSTSTTQQIAALVTHNEPDEVTPSRGRKGPKKQALANVPASKSDNATDVASERLRIVQRMADWKAKPKLTTGQT